MYVSMANYIIFQQLTYFETCLKISSLVHGSNHGLIFLINKPKIKAGDFW